MKDDIDREAEREALIRLLTWTINRVREVDAPRTAGLLVQALATFRDES